MTDFDYLKVAYGWATLSSDPSTQNGAILVDASGEIRVKAFNGFPRQVEHKDERWERPTKYSYVEHAERNAIYQAAYLGIPTKGLTMYCPWYACTDCARAIIQTGIRRVVGHNHPSHDGGGRWKESIEIANTMFREAGVLCEYLDGTIGDVAIRLNGTIVYP